MSWTERYNFNSFEVTFGHDPLYQLETVNIKARKERETEKRNFPLINFLAVWVSQISQHVKTNTGLNVWFHLGAVTNLTDNPHKWPLSFSYQITGLESCLRWHQAPLAPLAGCNHLEEEKYHKSGHWDSSYWLQDICSCSLAGQPQLCVVSETLVRATDELPPSYYNPWVVSWLPLPRYNWNNVQPQGSDVCRPQDLSAVCIFPSWVLTHHTTAVLPGSGDHSARCIQILDNNYTCKQYLQAITSIHIDL